MTTYISAPVNIYNSASLVDATFREMGLNIKAALTAIGLVQTADTGQINWVTVLRPGTGANGGYEIWGFNDTRQGTDPLYVKIFYGCGNSATHFRLQIQTGTGTNGSGTLTGQNSVVASTGGDIATNANTTAPIYACHTEGYFLLLNGVGTVGNGIHNMLSVSRTKNASGNFDSVGNVAWSGGTTPTAVNGLAFTRTGSSQFSGLYNTNLCIVPGLPADSALLDGSKQLYPIWYADPAVTQLWSQFVVNQSPFPSTPSTFSALPFAGQTKTFIFMGNTTGTSYPPAGEVTGNATYRPAFLWE